MGPYVDLSGFAIACGAAGESQRLTEAHTNKADKREEAARCQQKRANAWVRAAMTRWYKRKNGGADPPFPPKKTSKALVLPLEKFLDLYAPAPL